MSEYDELVKKLRDEVLTGPLVHLQDWTVLNKLHTEAAYAIQALQEQNEELRHDIERATEINAELAKELAHSELNILSLEDDKALLGHQLSEARNAALEEAAKRMDNNASMLNDAADKLLDPEAATGLNARANYYKDAALVIRSLKGE